jgi:hypothetical protein
LFFLAESAGIVIFIGDVPEDRHHLVTWSHLVLFGLFGWLGGVGAIELGRLLSIKAVCLGAVDMQHELIDFLVEGQQSGLVDAYPRTEGRLIIDGL